eukprot:1141894-Pelagomonas_calceolata.AAC.1
MKWESDDVCGTCIAHGNCEQAGGMLQRGGCSARMAIRYAYLVLLFGAQLLSKWTRVLWSTASKRTVAGHLGFMPPAQS